MSGPGIFAPNAAVPVPNPPPLATPLRVQLRANDGACWEASYSATGVQRNDAAGFTARSD
jgi:hypothetical protein